MEVDITDAVSVSAKLVQQKKDNPALFKNWFNDPDNKKLVTDTQGAVNSTTDAANKAVDDLGGGGSNTGAIVGGVLGGIAGVGVIAGIVYYMKKKKS